MKTGYTSKNGHCAGSVRTGTTLPCIDPSHFVDHAGSIAENRQHGIRCTLGLLYIQTAKVNAARE